MFVWLCIDLFKQIHLLMSIKLRIAKISASFQQDLKFRKILKKGLSIGKHKFKMKKNNNNNKSRRWIQIKMSRKLFLPSIYDSKT